MTVAMSQNVSVRTRTPTLVASLTAMMLSIGYLTAATGPWLLGAVHNAASGWGPAVAALLLLTLSQLLPGLRATRPGVIESV
jgi:MFS transporter, CP family, cyanate transporter